ncbi:MAG: C39 family peptidase [Victivallaceae bacterium]|nr:C39 family peptidase [Victivallaceae bacterium]
MKRFSAFFLLFCATWSGAADFVGNVKRVNDKVFIDGIPQISQKRNFCAPASAAMILGYFDARMTQNKLARLFDTSKKRGTTSDDIIAEFSHGDLRDFSIRRIYALTTDEFAMLFDAYAVLPKVSASKVRKLQKHGYDAFGEINPSLAVPLFAEKRTRVRQILLDAFRENIDRGIPMLWSVEMNLDPDEKISGGHMRVLGGYTVDKDGAVHGVLYRDPWGRHKHFKEMSLDNAVAMTYEILVVAPVK